MPASAHRYRLVVITKNKKNPAYVGARLGADRVAARHGCVVTHLTPDKPDDIDEQRALIEAARAEHPDALLIAPAHATALNGALRQVQADGTPVFCFVSRPDAFDCTCYVGSDDRALARGIAGYLFDRLERGGDVVTLEGHPDAITTAPRAAGFREAAAERGNIRIVDSRPGYFLRDGGHAAMTELLASRAPHRRSPGRQRLHGARRARCHAGGWAKDPDRRRSTPRRKAWRRSRPATCWPRPRSMP